MKIIGITGGVGAGKSQVLDYLHKEYGAAICKADEIGKLVEKKGTDCFHKIVEAFGEEVVAWNGELNRSKLGDIVFQNDEKLKILNSIVHPAVEEMVFRIIEEEKQKGTALFMLESAILIGSGLEPVCDEVWYIYVKQENRKNRLIYARGYSEEKVESIFSSQMTKQEFFKNCDRVVDNNGVFGETTHQLDVIIRDLFEE